MLTVTVRQDETVDGLYFIKLVSKALQEYWLPPVFYGE